MVASKIYELTQAKNYAGFSDSVDLMHHMNKWLRNSDYDVHESGPYASSGCKQGALKNITKFKLCVVQSPQGLCVSLDLYEKTEDPTSGISTVSGGALTSRLTEADDLMEYFWRYVDSLAKVPSPAFVRYEKYVQNASGQMIAQGLPPSVVVIHSQHASTANPPIRPPPKPQQVHQMAKELPRPPLAKQPDQLVQKPAQQPEPPKKLKQLPQLPPAQHPAPLAKKSQPEQPQPQKMAKQLPQPPVQQRSHQPSSKQTVQPILLVQKQAKQFPSPSPKVEQMPQKSEQTPQQTPQKSPQKPAQTSEPAQKSVQPSQAPASPRRPLRGVVHTRRSAAGALMRPAKTTPVPREETFAQFTNPFVLDENGQSVPKPSVISTESQRNVWDSAFKKHDMNTMLQLYDKNMSSRTAGKPRN